MINMRLDNWLQVMGFSDIELPVFDTERNVRVEILTVFGRTTEKEIFYVLPDLDFALLKDTIFEWLNGNVDDGVNRYSVVIVWENFETKEIIEVIDYKVFSVGLNI